MSKKSQKRKRFPLMVYQQLYKMWFWPSLLLFVSSLIPIIFNPPRLASVRWYFLPITLISLGLMIYALMARYTTYVQAHPHSLRIKSPFFRLVLSYGRIHLIRTTPFKAQYAPENLSVTRRRLADRLYGHTCLVVEVREYPMPIRALSVFLNYFLLARQVKGFVLLTEDWLQLSNDIEGARAEWVNRRLMSREKRAVEQILRK